MNANYNDQIQIQSQVINTGLEAHTFLFYGVMGVYDAAAFRKYAGLPILSVEGNVSLDPDEVKDLTLLGRILPAAGDTLYSDVLNYVVYSSATLPIREALAIIIDNITVVWYRTPEGVWLGFDPTAPDWVNDLTEMVSGEKYWVTVSETIATPIFAVINIEVYPPGRYDIILGVIDPLTNVLLDFDVRLGAIELLVPPSPA